MALISKGPTESFCVQQPLAIVKPGRREVQSLGFIYWQLEAMPPEKLEETFYWLCESWIVSWTCALCVVFLFYAQSPQSLPRLSFSHSAQLLSLITEKSDRNFPVLSVFFSVLSSPSFSFFTSLCLSHSLPCCSQMSGFAQGLQDGIEHAWNNMFLLNLSSFIASWN